MESGSTDNDTTKTDSDISSDKDDHDDRWNGVLSNCDEEEVESDYGEWSVVEGSGDGKSDLDDSFNIVSSASGRVVKPLKYLKDFTLDRNKCHSINKLDALGEWKLCLISLIGHFILIMHPLAT